MVVVAVVVVARTGPEVPSGDRLAGLLGLLVPLVVWLPGLLVLIGCLVATSFCLLCRVSLLPLVNLFVSLLFGCCFSFLFACFFFSDL